MNEHCSVFNQAVLLLPNPSLQDSQSKRAKGEKEGDVYVPDLQSKGGKGGSYLQNEGIKRAKGEKEEKEGDVLTSGFTKQKLFTEQRKQRGERGKRREMF